MPRFVTLLAVFLSAVTRRFWALAAEIPCVYAHSSGGGVRQRWELAAAAAQADSIASPRDPHIVRKEGPHQASGTERAQAATHHCD